jgi:dipeptidyl aminopeptidase/acylaminoacyl peptidase
MRSRSAALICAVVVGIAVGSDTQISAQPSRSRLAAASPAPAPSAAGLAPADQFAIKDIGEIRVSPDGATMVYSVTTTDVSTNSSMSRLMKIPAAGGQPAELPGVPAGASNVRWSPDSSRIAFIATVAARSGIWVYDMTSEALTRVSDYDRTNRFVSKAGNALAWSPDGKQLAFAGTLEAAPPAGDPLTVTRLQYKTRTAFADDRWTHIYVVPATGGTPRQVTRGNTDHHSIDWGTTIPEIVFLKNPEPDPDANHNYDLYAVDLASGRERRITETPGVEMEPRVSPDGRWIAYTATTRPVTTIDSVAEDSHVWVVPFGGGDARELNRALDRRSASPEWAPDSRAVLYLASDHGKTVLYRVPLAGGASTAVIDRKAQVGPYSVARDGLVGIAITDPHSPREVFRLRPDGDPKPLTTLNAATVKQWKLSTPEPITFKSFDGLDVEGWFYPALSREGPTLSNGGRAQAESTPMILSIHGGPHGMYGYGFNAAFQINAARGYATLAINPRGSAGYGQAFADGSVRSWGDGDYKDLMAGVEHVLKTKPEVDPDRLGVMGGSYGGFMTNWIITQTDRFKAAVSSASVSNLISFYATSLYQDLVHAEFDGFPWSGNFELLWKWSPLAHVQNVATPTLFVHGELDNDVHITQAEEMFTAMRRRGIEAVLARYPREGHGFREPKHILDRTERTLAWFDRFLMPGGTSQISR